MYVNDVLLDQHSFGSINQGQTKYGVLQGEYTPATNTKIALEIYNSRTLYYQGSFNYVDHITVTPQQATFRNIVEMIPVAYGGSADLTYLGGMVQGNRNYLVLGGFHGSLPGVQLPPHFLPLNIDATTYYILQNTNTPIFQNFEGTLDFIGYCKATFDTNGALPPFMAGSTLTFALVVLQGPRQVPIYHISNPVLVSFY